MKCVRLKGWAHDAVWGERAALAALLLPLFVPFVLIVSAEHVLTPSLDELTPWKPSKARH